jgi:hypothetical protein
VPYLLQQQVLQISSLLLFSQWIYDKEAAKKVQKDREREEKQDLQLLSIRFAFVLGFDCVSSTFSI